jgi:hypothetical protein
MSAWTRWRGLGSIALGVSRKGLLNSPHWLFRFLVCIIVEIVTKHIEEIL